MKYIKEEIKKVVTGTIEYAVCDCIKCGSNNIKLFNIESYRTGLSAGGQCLDCKFLVDGSNGFDKKEFVGIHKFEAAAIWNNLNDPYIIVKNIKAKIKEHNKSIETILSKLNVSSTNRVMNLLANEKAD